MSGRTIEKENEKTGSVRVGIKGAGGIGYSIKNEVKNAVNTNILQPTDADERMEIETAPAISSIKNYKKQMREMEIRHIAESLSLAVPTVDLEVKSYLRQFCHPICLFGEGPYERRERLRMLVARVCAGEDAAEKVAWQAEETEGEEEEEEEELFFIKGTEELKNARMSLAEYSLYKTYNRIQKQNELRDNFTKVEFDEDRSAYIKHIQENFAVTVSQVGDDRPLTCGRFSPDSKLFASSSWTGFVKLWSLPDCECIHTLRGHTDRVNAITWRPSASSRSPYEDSHYYNTSADYDIDMENIEKGKEQEKKQNGFENEKIKLDHMDVGNYGEGVDIVSLASGGADTNILLWSTKKSYPLGILKGHEERINSLDFHACGNYLASCSHDETWRFWDVCTGKELFFHEGHAYPIYALKCHYDGSLVFTGDLGGIVRATDIRTGRTVAAIIAHSKQILGVDVDPQSAYKIATCSDDHCIKIWDIRKMSEGEKQNVNQTNGNSSGEEKKVTSVNTCCLETILAHNKLVSDCRYEPVRGRYILSSSYDCYVKLWSTEDYSCACVLHAHDSRVMSIDISNCGKMIASLSYDRTWKLWMNQTKFVSDIPQSYFIYD